MPAEPERLPVEERLPPRLAVEALAPAPDEPLAAVLAVEGRVPFPEDARVPAFAPVPRVPALAVEARFALAPVALRLAAWPFPEPQPRASRLCALDMEEPEFFRRF